MISGKFVRVALCSGALGLAASITVGGAVASAAPSPKLLVIPSTNLHTGEVVKVSGSGFEPGDSVYIVQCLITAKGESNCDILNTVPAKISKTGVLPTSRFKVSTGKIGNGSCGTKTSNLKSCAVSVGNISGGDSAVHRISFKKK